MKKGIALAVVLSLATVGAARAEPGEETWTAAQREVLSAIDALSATTAPDGTGADSYGAVLDGEYSRWTLGGDTIHRKAPWVEGVREWFDDGWRVSDRKARVLEITLRGDLAFVRRIVEETFLGPEGETSTGSAALAEVWVKKEDRWLLLRVDAHPLEHP